MKIVLKTAEGRVGEYCQGVARIDLSKDTHNPGSTAIHETIHHLYPKMLEKDVLRWERRIWKNMGSTARIRVYKALLAKRANYIIKLVKETIR